MPINVVHFDHPNSPGFEYKPEKGERTYLVWPPKSDSDTWSADISPDTTYATGLTAKGAMEWARFPVAIQQAFWTAIVNAGIDPER